MCERISYVRSCNPRLYSRMIERAYRCMREPLNASTTTPPATPLRVDLRSACGCVRA
jgi:hypothetical protein